MIINSQSAPVPTLNSDIVRPQKSPDSSPESTVIQTRNIAPIADVRVVQQGEEASNSNALKDEAQEPKRDLLVREEVQLRDSQNLQGKKEAEVTSGNVSKDEVQEVKPDAVPNVIQSRIFQSGSSQSSPVPSIPSQSGTPQSGSPQAIDGEVVASNNVLKNEVQEPRPNSPQPTQLQSSLAHSGSAQAAGGANNTLQNEVQESKSGASQSAASQGAVAQEGESRQAVSSQGSGAQNSNELLTEDELREVELLSQRDSEVRTHEQAHLSAAGGRAIGGASFSFTSGPDGQRYATGGEVKIDTSPVRGDPEATLRAAALIQRAAQAPAEPSSQDRQVAAQAAAMAQEASTAISQQRAQASNEKTEPESEAREVLQSTRSDDAAAARVSDDSSGSTARDSHVDQTKSRQQQLNAIVNTVSQGSVEESRGTNLDYFL